MSSNAFIGYANRETKKKIASEIINGGTFIENESNRNPLRYFLSRPKKNRKNWHFCVALGAIRHVRGEYYQIRVSDAFGQIGTDDIIDLHGCSDAEEKIDKIIQANIQGIRQLYPHCEE